MSLRPIDIASMIPEKYRAYIVEENLIYKAIATNGDAHMEQLTIIWTNHVEKGVEIDKTCPTCLRRILDNYRIIEADLIDLVRADKLLEDA